jgi:hypothetical protein
VEPPPLLPRASLITPIDIFLFSPFQSIDGGVCPDHSSEAPFGEQNEMDGGEKQKIDVENNESEIDNIMNRKW